MFGEEFANLIEDTSVGSWVRTWGAPDWRLVDDDNFVELFDSLDIIMSTGDSLCVMEASLKFVCLDAVYESGFARAGDAGNHSHNTKRKMSVDVFEIIFAGASYY